MKGRCCTLKNFPKDRAVGGRGKCECILLRMADGSIWSYLCGHQWSGVSPPPTPVLCEFPPVWLLSISCQKGKGVGEMKYIRESLRGVAFDRKRLKLATFLSRGSCSSEQTPPPESVRSQQRVLYGVGFHE